MKKYVAIVLLVAFFFATCSSHYAPPYESSEAPDYEKGYLDGKLQAGRRSQQGWVWGGCGGALVAGILGGGIVMAMGYNSAEYPPFEAKGTDAYKRGYVNGYQDGSASAKGSKATTGCLVGTLINVAAIVLIYSLSSD